MFDPEILAQLKRFEKTRRRRVERIISRRATAELIGRHAHAARKRGLQQYRDARADHAHAVIELQRHGVDGLELFPT